MCMVVSASRPHSSFDVIISNYISPYTVQHSDKLLAIILKLLKPSGKFILKDETNMNSTLKLNGFVNVTKDCENSYVAEKPKFEVSYIMENKLYHTQ